MPHIVSNGVRVEYDARGDGPTVLLIMGIGTQLVHWAEGFCDNLAGRGYRVVRFDNRDMGLSSWFDGPPVDVPGAIARRMAGLPVRAPYDLGDMADDAAGLLDGLGVARAHVAGISMGGMIAQTFALRHPDRLRSLTSWSSHPGARRYLVGKPASVRALLRPPPRTEDEAVARLQSLLAVIGSPAWPRDPATVERLARLSWNRGYNPQGFARQLLAIMASGSRLGALPAVRAPTLVLHGKEDPLILPAAGVATAAAIPGARLELVEGLGHDLPEAAWDLLADHLAAHWRAADRA